MTNATAGFAELVGGKYINLETRRKNGDGVRTPVWFAAATADTQPFAKRSRFRLRTCLTARR